MIAGVTQVVSDAATAASSTSSSTAATTPPVTENMFLQLLVAQLQNQDPTDPSDSTQFVTQLTGYSQLEQLINIDTNTTPAAAAAATKPATV